MSGARDHCAVMAVWGHPEMIILERSGLSHGNTRGQEGSGMSAANGEDILTQTGQGLVSEVWSERSDRWNAMRAFPKPIFVIGHDRYSTKGSSVATNLQPVKIDLTVFGPNRHYPERKKISTCSNGDLVNMMEQRQFLSDHGADFGTSVDVEVIGWSIAYHHVVRGLPIAEAIGKMMKYVRGAYSGLLATENTLYAFRDPNGIRPFSRGEDPIAFASETCMLEAIGSKVVGEVKRGQVIEVSRNGKLYFHQVAEPQRSRLCSFEYVYISRPDSNLDGKRVHLARKNAGAYMIKKYPVPDADLISFMPETGASAAIGASHESGIRYDWIFVKNRYRGRGFIYPEQSKRKAVAKENNPIREDISDKTIVVFEDSTVRGTTLKELIQVLFACGAKKIYLYLASAPYSHCCYFGVDTSDPDDLLTSQWAHLPIEEIEKNVAEYLDGEGTTRLVVRYLRSEEYEQAYGMKVDESCLSCFTGEYPMEIPSQAPTKSEAEDN